jgi:hypothetical protein
MSTLSLSYGEHLLLFEFWKIKSQNISSWSNLLLCMYLVLLKMNINILCWPLWKKITKSINHTFRACHLHVQPKILHFVELSFWNSYSKLERKNNLVWCKKLKRKLLPTCKVFFFFWGILLIPISFLFLFFFWHLDFWIMDSTMGIVCC